MLELTSVSIIVIKAVILSSIQILPAVKYHNYRGSFLFYLFAANSLNYICVSFTDPEYDTCVPVQLSL